MLEQFSTMNTSVSNLIIYCNSASLQLLLKGKLKERFKIERYRTKYADNLSTLKEVKGETMIEPFGGGKWFVDVQVEDIPINSLKKYLGHVTDTSVTVYWVDKYNTYKKMLELAEVKEQGYYCNAFYLGRLEPIDITYVHNNMLEDGKQLNKELLEYVKKNYTYNVDAICTLFEKINKGEEVKKTKDIVRLVGLGGNTVDNFIIKLLTMNPKKAQGLRQSVTKQIVLLKDLNLTYNYNTIYNYGSNTVSTILDMKQLQIMGKLSAYIRDIPSEEYNTQRINRLRRFESTILEEISIARVIQLKSIILKYKSYDSEIAWLQVIMNYLTIVQQSNEGEE